MNATQKMPAGKKKPCRKKAPAKPRVSKTREAATKNSGQLTPRIDKTQTDANKNNGQLENSFGLATENARIRRTKLFKGIRDDLLGQIERNGTVGKYYVDLIGDYMDMWLLKCALVRDVEEKGLTVTFKNARGEWVHKKNDSVELRIKVNAQMLKLLSEIGIKPAQAGGEDDEL